MGEIFTRDKHTLQKNINNNNFSIKKMSLFLFFKTGMKQDWKW